MNREGYQRVREIFHAACELAPDARSRYLDEVCADQPDIRHDVESLFDLERHDVAAALDTPAAGASVLRNIASPHAAGTTSVQQIEPGFIGRYRLLELIGEGGFGTVYLAEQTEPVVRRVALKIIKAGMDTKQVIARFEAERQALAMMDHPNIARVLDAGATDAGRPYFVMELVHGVPLTDYCDRERLSVRERLRLFVDVCGAVQHAHQKGVIHRDLKPANILLAYDKQQRTGDREPTGTELRDSQYLRDGHNARPTPKVLDFGIAKATSGRLTDKSLHTELHQLIGTPLYMSPEQAEGSGADIDTRSDVYALGVLLYELLSGTTPLDGNRLRSMSLAEVQRAIREEEPPKPSTRLSAMRTEPSAFGGSGSGVSIAALPHGRGSDDSSSAGEIAFRRGTDPATLARRLRGDLDWIVMKCLEKDRDRRYSTASALADDIGRYLDHQPVLATPLSTSYKLRKFVRRNRGAVIAGSTVTLALLTATVVSIAFGVSAGRQRIVAESALARAEKAEVDARARAHELEQVAGFQAAQLSDIDAQTMGSRLRADLLATVRAAAERSLPSEQAAARLGELEALIAGNDFTGMALRALDQNFFQPALAAIDREFSSQPLVKARLLQTLASTLQELGLLDAAGKPQQEALSTRRRELGEEHIDTLHSIQSMGLLLVAQGRLTEAEPYFHEALEKCRRVLGDEHPSTLLSMQNMGYLLREQGDSASAEQYYRQVLEKSRRVLGEDHPETITIINNLGASLHGQGRLAEAETCYREALDKSRRVKGEEHPDTLLSISNLGVLLQYQGRPAEAEPFYREALESRRRLLGDEHPHTLMSIANMGYLLFSEGKLAEAEPFYREALATRVRVLGGDHPRTLNSINNLAGLLKEQGKFVEAEPLYREALEKRRRVLGEEHADTIGSINNMGWMFEGQGKLSEAEPYYREALEKYRRTLGDDHRDTLVSITNMSSLLLAQGKPAEAAALLAPAEQAVRREFTGGNAVRLGRFLTLLGRAHAATADFESAQARLVEAREILGEATGVTKRDNAEVLNALVELYSAWHEAMPNKGYDVKAAEWRARFAEWQASTQPAIP